MIDKIATGLAAKYLFDKIGGGDKTDKTAPGSKEEVRDGKNVGMEGGIENHSYDLSTRDALNLLAQRKAEGKPVTGDDMKAVFKALADSGQITREEWMDLREYVTENYNTLSPEAKSAFDKFDTGIQDAGNPVGWFDGNKDGKTRNDAVVKGADLKTLLEKIDGPPAKSADKVDAPSTQPSGGGSNSGNSDVKSPSSGPASGTDGANAPKGAPGPGAGWGAIIAYIMQLVTDKEKILKQRALDTASALDESVKSDNAETAKANANAKTGTSPAPTDTATDPASSSSGTAPKKTGTENLKVQLAEIQDEMKKLDQLTELMTNLLNSVHQTTSKVIGNIR